MLAHACAVPNVKKPIRFPVFSDRIMMFIFLLFITKTL